MFVECSEVPRASVQIAGRFPADRTCGSAALCVAAKWAERAVFMIACSRFIPVSFFLIPKYSLGKFF